MYDRTAHPCPILRHALTDTDIAHKPEPLAETAAKNMMFYFHVHTSPSRLATDSTVRQGNCWSTGTGIVLVTMTS